MFASDSKLSPMTLIAWAGGLPMPALWGLFAFLSSFENYNTTTFAILADKTLVTVLAGEVRQGTTPVLSALAVIIIGMARSIASFCGT